MKKGRLNRRVTIFKADAEDDGFSSNPGGPVEIGKRWMEKTDVSDGERIRAEGFGTKITSRFLCRYDRLSSTIRAATHSLICEGVMFNITGVKEVGFREGIEITAASDLVQS